jgi:DNA-binding FadR family transcriptional regulator
VNGRGVIVALAHAGLVEVRRRLGRSLNDHETAALASLYLQESLEADRDSGNQTRFVPRTEVERLATALGLLPAN